MQSDSSPPGTTSDERRWVLSLAALVLIALVFVVVIATWSLSTTSSGFGWMMGGNWSWMWGIGAFMMAIPLIFLVLLVALLLRPRSPQPWVVSTSMAPDPVLEVRMRFARGEITSDQYRQMLDELRATR